MTFSLGSGRVGRGWRTGCLGSLIVAATAMRRGFAFATAPEPLDKGLNLVSERAKEWHREDGLWASGVRDSVVGKVWIGVKKRGWDDSRIGAAASRQGFAYKYAQPNTCSTQGHRLTIYLPFPSHNAIEPRNRGIEDRGEGSWALNCFPAD
jgi:hypothetical protein